MSHVTMGQVTWWAPILTMVITSRERYALRTGQSWDLARDILQLFKKSGVFDKAQSSRIILKKQSEFF